MGKAIDHYYRLRLIEVKTALESNHFEVFLADNVGQAKELVVKEIVLINQDLGL